jgi:hypothetical protein
MNEINKDEWCMNCDIIYIYIYIYIYKHKSCNNEW